MSLKNRKRTYADRWLVNGGLDLVREKISFFAEKGARMLWLSGLDIITKGVEQKVLAKRLKDEGINCIYVTNGIYEDIVLILKEEEA